MLNITIRKQTQITLIALLQTTGDKVEPKIVLMRKSYSSIFEIQYQPINRTLPTSGFFEGQRNAYNCIQNKITRPFSLFEINSFIN